MRKCTKRIQHIREFGNIEKVQNQKLKSVVKGDVELLKQSITPSNMPLPTPISQCLILIIPFLGQNRLVLADFPNCSLPDFRFLSESCKLSGPPIWKGVSTDRKNTVSVRSSAGRD
ncbi:Uncharacterized protein Fot_09055 [Forsythia ovata]|uniref:Uncharacterized protein n=1 Tax=Forsythia ovata TaxID=205694 RepID=A0ABD1WDG4_9LAMI